MSVIILLNFFFKEIFNSRNRIREYFSIMIFNGIVFWFLKRSVLTFSIL